MKRARITVFVVTAVGSLTPGCADAPERYREFSRRAAETGFDAGTPTPVPGCAPPPPGSIEGRALLAIENSLGPGLPILFFGEIGTPEIGGKTHVVFDYRPLDATDRTTPLGEPLHVGPYAVQPNGDFVAEMPEQTLPGAANPILPGVPITSELVLSASICGVSAFYCGSVTGRTTSPLQGDVAGRFGLTILGADEPSPPARPRYGCDPEDIARPLAE